MKASEFLQQAKALIDTPEKWTQEVCARDIDGVEVPAAADNATCFCSLGAIRKLKTTRPQTAINREAAITYLHLAMDSDSIAEYNDTHTHAEVMAAWDKAIELAQADEAIY